MRQIKALPADVMPIGELSRLFGVHIETIRYYEKIKMLPAPPRTESGRRVYGPKETRILGFDDARDMAWKRHVAFFGRATIISSSTRAPGDES